MQLDAAQKSREKKAGGKAALLDDEQRLASIVASAMDAIISIDSDQRIILFNAAAEEIFGWKAEEMAGQPLTRLIPTRFRPAHAAHVRAFERTGTSTRRMGALGEVSGLRANGEEFPIEASISQVEIAGNRIFTVILRDITERKRVEEQMRLADAALATAANGVAITAQDGCFLSVNAAFTRITGYTLDEVRGQDVRMLNSGAQDEAFYQELWRTVLAGGAWSGELLNRRKDGGLYNEELTVTPVRTAAGRITHWVAINQDVTERKKLEREMVTAAEREQERIGRDLHDGLCQVLAVAKLRAALLAQSVRRGSPVDSADADMIESLIGESIKQGRGLAHGLSPVKPGPGALAEALLQLAHFMNTDGGPHCICNIPQPVSIAEQSTAIHLYRIAQEAVQNALKYSGAKTIVISLTQKPDAVQLEIADDGGGMEGGATQTTGQGLRNMRARTSLIGGRLDIKSSKGKGTAVVCRLHRPVATAA